jgi:hypothetical protein
MIFFSSKRTKVAQTAESVAKQIDDFLVSQKLEVNASMRELAAGMLQHEQADADSFDPERLGAAIRRLIFNQHLFAVIQKAKKERKEEEAAKKAAEETKPEVTENNVVPINGEKETT